MRIFPCALAALLGLASTATVQAQSYSFSKVADTTSGYTDFWAPALNNTGMVAFNAWSTTGIGIYKGPSPRDDAIVKETDRMSIRSRYPALDDHGTVAFIASWLPIPGGGPSIAGVFTGTDPVNDQVAGDNDLFTRTGWFIDSVTLNNSGGVAFYAGLTNGVRGIFSGPDPTADVLVDTSGAFRTILRETSGPALNDHGQFAFHAFTDSSAGIFTGPNPSTDKLVDSSGPLIGFDNVVINNNGLVAFTAGMIGETRGIYTGPDPVNDAVATNDGLYDRFLRIDLNNHGVIAFRASLDDGGEGVFTGADPAADKVVRTGDSLFGSVVTGIDFNRGFNDAGQVAFSYTLASGVSGIAIATPIPEPATFMLASSFLAAVCVARRNRRAPDAGAAA